MQGFGYHDHMQVSRELFRDVPFPEGVRWMQDALITGKVSDWRYGFRSSSRCGGSPNFFVGITPYGVQRLETDFCTAARDFGVFDLTFLRKLCESCLPDFSVANIIDNCISMRLSGEVPAHRFAIIQAAYINVYAKKSGWDVSGTAPFIVRDDGHVFSDQSHLPGLLEGAKSRAVVVPFKKAFVPRSSGAEEELQYHPDARAVLMKDVGRWALENVFGAASEAA